VFRKSFFLVGLLLWLALALLAACPHARAAETVRVADPYIELRTGPGVGYPIFYVIDKGEPVTVLKRRTDWFKVRAPGGQEGWVHHQQLARTLDDDGQTVAIPEPGIGDYSQRRWEMGVLGGDFSGARLISVYLGYAFSDNLSLELSLGHAVGSHSGNSLGNVNLTHRPFPDWRVQPFALIGVGILHTTPSTTLIRSEDRTDTTLQAGLGLQAYLSRRFLIRAEYRNHVVQMSGDDNEEIDQWQLGIAFFF